MKKIISPFLFVILSLNAESYDLELLRELLSLQAPDHLALRAPIIPSALGTSLGSVAYKGNNGTTSTLGAQINGYYGIPGSGAAAPNINMPGNIGFATVPTPSALNNITARLLITAATGYCGVGNFIPGTGSNNGLPNAVLNIEGDNTASASSALHVGSRVTPINSVVSGTAYSTQVDGNLYNPNYAQFNSGLNVTQQFNIVQAQFIRTADLPLTISSPGLYIFADNITSSSANAIVINSSNVTLDLNQFSLSTANTASVAITINASLSNITIKNGTINNFAQGIVASTSDNNVVIDTITFTAINQQSISSTSANTNWRISKCLIANSVISNTASVVQLNSLTNSIIEDCVVNNCSATLGSLIVFSIGGSSNCIFRNCVVTDCLNLVAGFDFNAGAGTGVTLENCDVCNCSNSTTSATLSAFRLNTPVSNIILRNCNVNNFSTGASNITSAFAVATGTGTDIQRNILQGCIAGGNSSGGQTFGFNVQSALPLLEDCIAFGNSSTASALASAVGFIINQTSRVGLSRVIAFGQTAGAAANSAIGIYLNSTATTQNRSLINNCTSFGHAVGAFGTGMLITDSNNVNQIVGNISTKNTTNYSTNSTTFLPQATQQAATIAAINTTLTQAWINAAITA